MPDLPTDNTLFGADPHLKASPMPLSDGEPGDATPLDARGQCLIFCPRCGIPSDGASDFCGRCGARRCVSCGE